MYEDRARRGRTICADCRYSLMRLDKFEGDSSLDAPEAGNRGFDSSPDIGWKFVTYPWRLLKGIWGGESQNRRKQVAKLRQDILPSEPDAMICPMCLRVAFPDELHGA